MLQLLLSALVAALTILGKAFCKQIALENSTPIVYAFARIIYRFKRIFGGKKQRDGSQNRGAQVQERQNRGAQVQEGQNRSAQAQDGQNRGKS